MKRCDTKYASRWPTLGLSADGWILLACVAQLGTGCSREAAQAKEVVDEQRTPVRLAAVERGTLVRTLHAVGRVHLKSEVNLAFKVGGIVTKISVDEGSHVRKGQRLATLDPSEVTYEVARTREVLSKATRDLERAKHLHTAKSLALVDVQNAETALAVAITAGQAADFNLAHTEILAPHAGIIDAKVAEEGEIVAPGQAVLHLLGGATGAVVRAAVGERDVLLLKVGDRARVALSAAPKTWLPAHISLIASSANPGTGTFDVEFTFDKPEKALLSGLSARVEIDHPEPDVSGIVPVSSLVEGSVDEASVYVVRNQRAAKVPVTVDFLMDTRVALLRGLEHEPYVVEMGAEQLVDGALVHVVP
jgi:multidrug efflux system membrane fusion protein